MSGFSEEYADAVAYRARAIAIQLGKASGHREEFALRRFRAAVIERLAIEQALAEISPLTVGRA